jgi:hypothetical protein
MSIKICEVARMKPKNHIDRAARITAEIMLLETDFKTVKTPGLSNYISNEIAQKKISLDLLRTKSIGHAGSTLLPTPPPLPSGPKRCAPLFINKDQVINSRRRHKDAQGSWV